MSNINVHLNKTFNLTQNDYRAYVFTKVPYAIYVEEPSKYEGYYFMTKAFKKGKNAIRKTVVDNIIKQIKTRFKR